jgi:flavoprotein
VLQQNIDEDVFISMITTKLPKEVLVQLEIQKGTGVKWFVRKLRHLYKGYVLTREAAESQAKDRNNEFKSPIVHAFSNTRYRQLLIKPCTPCTTSEALMSSTSDRALTFDRGEANKICIYCKSTQHWSDKCETYKTVDERKRKLHGLCFICLKTGHRLKDCKSDRKCVYCGKS